MTEFFLEYGLFLAKTITLVLAVLFLLGVAMANAIKSRKEMEKGSLHVTHLNEHIDEMCQQVKDVVLDKHLLKLEGKAEKKKAKQEKKARKSAGKQAEQQGRKRVYVIDFEGDVKASQVDNLRKVITAVLAIARADQDEIMLRLESPGGMIHSYGLAASQLDRIRNRHIPLTICVDKVAASGGYMMACLGNRIIASPFAYIGSIGVVLQMPNFHRLLQDNKVDYEMVTAGEYKRTLTVFGENTDKDRAKVTQEIQEAHDLFKNFIREHRPSLNVDEVATGETWFGSQAVGKGLIDEIKTSDEYIVEACSDADVYAVTYEEKKKISERLGKVMENSVSSALLNWAQKAGKQKFFS